MLSKLSQNPVLSSVIANFVFFFLGIFFKTYIYPIYKKYTNPLRNILPFGSNPSKIDVAYGLIQPSYSKQIFTVEEGDMLIIQGINNILSTIYSKKSIRINSYLAIEHNLEAVQNIVTLSGPKWNRITEHFIGQLGSPVRFGKAYDLDGLVIVDDKNQIIDSFESKRTPSTLAQKCYGFIIAGKVRRSDGLFQNVLICAGNSTLSSYGTILLLRNLLNDRKESKKIKKSLSAKKIPWGIIIEVSNSQIAEKHFPLDPSYVKLKPIKFLIESDFLPMFDYKY